LNLTLDLSESPDARKGHTTLQFNNTLVVFGGISVVGTGNTTALVLSNTTMLYDIRPLKPAFSLRRTFDSFSLCTATDTWEQPFVPNIDLKGRFGHSAVKLNDTHMLIHGGNGSIPGLETYIFNVCTPKV